MLIGQDDPIIFPINSTKLILGSGEHCDIIVSASGISRKHLTITTEDDRYFVTDMGSTNGSFINEERLVPGRKVEFTSFFPVRLGDNTLVSLLSDEEDLSGFSIPVPKENTSPSIRPPARETEDSTTVINLKDLRNVRTENLVLERNKKREIRKKTQRSVKETPKPKKKINFVAWFSVLIVAAAAYYNFFVMEKVETEETVKEVGRVVKTTAPVEVKPDVNENLVAKDDLVSKEKFDTLRDNMKCTIDKEIYLCDLIPGARNPGFGVTQIGLSLYVFVDASYIFKQARNYMKNENDMELLSQTAAFAFVTQHLPVIDEEIIGDSRIFIGLYDKENETYNLKTILAFKPSAINKNRERLTPDQLKFIRSIGKTAIKFTEDIYTVY